MIAQYIPLYISELSGCFTVVRWGISQLLPGIHRPWPSSRCRRHRDTHHPWRHRWISTLGPRYPPPGEAIRGDPRLRKLTVGIEDDRIYIYMHNLCTIHNSIEKYMHTFWKSIFCIIVCIIFCLYFMGNRSCHWGDHLFDGDMMGDSWKSKDSVDTANIFTVATVSLRCYQYLAMPPSKIWLHPRATNGSNIMWLIAT